ncbi:MAG: hypothetical protein AVDCRST_MAG05-2923 [uncultured Rubrobacteraceae bacterium]|uniref:DUF4179 domain-containing protein n=1 Tax=uncultured Rubrobacteraceae bacterium TaxID=349277 RepID=A0A6J4SZ51_9ACTN|nr:MAG: hypothetical protein AVDCRST_MAG05-2923 [uncultured Rubrobacteraceae bacterium]
MASQRKRLEKALRGCAEAGVPDTMDLWPAVKERTTGERASAEPAGQGGNAEPHRRNRVPQFVPNTPLGWVLAAVSVLIVGVGIYAAAEPVRELFRQGLPGTVEIGTKKGGGTASHGEGTSGPQAGQTLVADDVKVTLNRVYADAQFVMIGYTIEDLKEDRNIGGHPSELTPIQIDDTDRTPEVETSDLPPRVNLTDGSGQDFDLVGGSTSHSQGVEEQQTPKEHLAVFAPSERLKAEGEQRFRFKIAVEETGIFLPGKNSAPTNPDSKVGPFAFDLEVPVRPAPVVQVDEEDTAEGISVTLDRVVNSPELPQAWICFEPPDDDYRDWTPWLAAQDSGPENEAMSPFQVGDGCWSLTLAGPVEGRSSITVAALDGFPRDPSDMREGPKTVRGPWTFEFEAPAR